MQKLLITLMLLTIYERWVVLFILLDTTCHCFSSAYVVRSRIMKWNFLMVNCHVIFVSCYPCNGQNNCFDSSIMFCTLLWMAWWSMKGFPLKILCIWYVQFMHIFCCSAGQTCSNSSVTYRMSYSSVLESFSQNYETGCGWWGLSRCRRTR